MRGQTLAVVRIRHGVNPDIIVCAPDGSHMSIALSDTDYGVENSSAQSSPPLAHLLDLNGLRRIAQILDDFRKQGRFSVPS
jgi:hypothetical protein